MYETLDTPEITQEQINELESYLGCKLPPIAAKEVSHAIKSARSHLGAIHDRKGVTRKIFLFLAEVLKGTPYNQLLPSHILLAFQYLIFRPLADFVLRYPKETAPLQKGQVFPDDLSKQNLVEKLQEEANRYPRATQGKDIAKSETLRRLVNAALNLFIENSTAPVTITKPHDGSVRSGKVIAFCNAMAEIAGMNPHSYNTVGKIIEQFRKPRKQRLE